MMWWEKLLPFSIWAILKGGFLVGLGVYILFAIVIVRQVAMMAQTISSSLNWLLRLFAWVHLLFSLLVFVFAWVIL